MLSLARRNPLWWIILKIHQRCNLNCSYCYVYNRGDDSWKSRPKQISNEVLDQVCLRIEEHCQKYSLDEFVVELHGGEPLLVGKPRLREIVSRMRERCPSTRLRFLLQTNGTLLDREWCRIFRDDNISVGVSVDGPAIFADQRRQFLNGKGSSDLVMRRLENCRSEGFEFGVLTVADPLMNGADLIDWYVENGIGLADILLPLGNSANPPDGWDGAAPYTRLLLAAFDRWFELGAAAPRIRLFETIIRGHLGIKAELDALGGDLGALCVVETNGAIGISDVIRLCGGCLALDSVDVFDIAFDQHVDQLGVEAVQAPSAVCLSCDQYRACGGGYVPHRYDGETFQNPSLYCESLFALSERVEATLLRELPRSLLTLRAA